MTPHERMIANQDFIEDKTVGVTRLERQQARGVRVEPASMAAVEWSIGFIWPMSFEEDRVKLKALGTRVNKIRSLNRPLP